MNRPLLPLVIAGTLLLAATFPLVAAKPGDEREDRRDETAEDASGRGRGRGGDDGNATMPAGTEGLRPGRSVGEFHAQSQAVQGEHVSFTYNETGVQDFAAAGVTLFDLTVSGATRDDRAARLPQMGEHGASLDLRAPTFRFKAHDNPGAVAKLDTDGVASLVFDATARLVEASERRVDFVVGNVSGSIRAEDVELQGQTVRASGETLVFLHQARGGFDKHREDIGQAIGKGHVGAEATIGRRADGTEIVQDVVSYGNVTMTTLKAEKGNLTLAVEGHGTEGRVIVLNVDGRVVGAQTREDLTILMDNMSVAPAESLADVLDPDNDGYLPEYYLVFDPATESFQLLVSVPHYSVHILSVTTPFVLPPPSVVVGIVAGVALLVPGAYVLFRRKE